MSTEQNPEVLPETIQEVLMKGFLRWYKKRKSGSRNESRKKTGKIKKTIVDKDK